MDTRFKTVGPVIGIYLVVAAAAFALGFGVSRFQKKPEGVVTAKDAQAGVTCYIARIGDAVGISCLPVAEPKPETKTVNVPNHGTEKGKGK